MEFFLKRARYGAVAAIALLYLFPLIRVDLQIPDQGTYLYNAHLVANGALPSREFVEVMGPGSFYWLATFFKIFGETLETARMVLLAEAAAMCALIFYLARRIGSSGIAAAAFLLFTAIPQMPFNSSHHDGNLLGLASFALLLIALDKAKPILFFAAGALAGATTCILLDKGVYLVAAYLAVLAIMRRRCFALVLGFAAPIVCVFAFYTYKGALHDLVFANWTWPLSRYHSSNAAPYGFQLFTDWWPRWWAVLRPHGSVSAVMTVAVLSMPWMTILAAPVALPVLGYISKSWTKELLPYWIVGYALWLAEAHRIDLGHLINGCPVLLILLFAICERSISRWGKTFSITATACATLVGALTFIGVTRLHVPVQTRRGGEMRREPDGALQFLITHTQPGDAVFVYPWKPIYYFTGDVRNPTRYSYLLYHEHSEAQFREAAKDLEDQKVRYVLWDAITSGAHLKTIFPAYQEPAREQQIMEPYLESHYRQIGFASGFRILERKSEAESQRRETAGPGQSTESAKMDRQAPVRERGKTL